MKEMLYINNRSKYVILNFKLMLVIIVTLKYIFLIQCHHFKSRQQFKNIHNSSPNENNLTFSYSIYEPILAHLALSCQISDGRWCGIPVNLSILVRVLVSATFFFLSSLSIFYNITFILFLVDLFSFFLQNLIKLGQNFLTEYFIPLSIINSKLLRLIFGVLNMYFISGVLQNQYWRTKLLILTLCL